jgi:Asp-tRNA(Asn)/Glu-tRNA(Gln) amidotransferase A subunit family amidase
LTLFVILDHFDKSKGYCYFSNEFIILDKTPEMKNISTLAAIVIALGLSAFYFTNAYITKEKIHNAAELIGLEFTDSEVDSMYNDVRDNLEDYNANRQHTLSNSLSPALQFNPLPPGFKIDTEDAGPGFSAPKEIPLPSNIDELAWFSIQDLAWLIKNKKISSVELTKFFLARLKKHDPILHCVITFTEQRAITQAKKMDHELENGEYRGILHGIPYGIKDLFAAKGYKTTWGAEPFRDQSFEEDATIVTKLEASGAVLIAKLSLGALAWGDVWYGEKTRNPWDPERGSSGSSAGSASAVAAGLVPFAIGTETLGSIVSPSTVCGTTGLRPTFGRVSRAGAMALSWSMDKAGPICRSIEDCAIVFEAIRGSDIKDQSTIDASFNYNSTLDARTMKIGYSASYFERDYTFKKQDSLALSILKNLGVELIPIELPEYPDITFILQAEAAAAFDDLTRSNKDDLLVRQIKNSWPNVFRASRFIPAVEYIQANRLRTALIMEMDSVMAEIDAFVHPSWAGSTLRITNMTGHPTVVIPNGFHENRPTSISFTGKLFGEAELMSIARFYQDATSWHLQHPEMFLK